MAQTTYYYHLEGEQENNQHRQFLQSSQPVQSCRSQNNNLFSNAFRKSSNHSEKTTRGNSPKFNEKKTKLSSKSPRINSSEINYPIQGCQYPSHPVNTTENLPNLATSHIAFDHHQNTDLSHVSINYAAVAPLSQGLNSELDDNNGDADVKYKTELCRNFELSGRCKFGNKCSFAHGKDELQNKKHINLHYKSKRCNKFFDNGFCEYGSRCQYLHKEDSFIHILDSYCEKLLVWMDRNPALDMSSIMRKTHAFVHRNSFFERLEKQSACKTKKYADTL